MDPSPDTASLFLQLVASKGMIDDALAKRIYQEAQSSSRDPSAILIERGILTAHLAENLRLEVQKALGPKVIGGFRVIERIGRGGMGTVYKAEQLSMARVVALKVLAEELSANAEFCDRFLREAKASAKVDHANVVTVHDAGRDGALLFIAMEYIGGGDAERFAASQGGRLPQRRAVEIIRDAAKGLEAIHQAGLIHRDIKPSNIFLTKKGQAKLADLGLSRSTAGDDRMTLTGSILGTPAFMSPEQARGDPDLDIRSDIYSLGASLYALLTGRSPYAGNSPMAIAAGVILQPFPDPSQFCPWLDAGLGALIRRCTAKAREERPQTPAELASALKEMLPHLDLFEVTPVKPAQAVGPPPGPVSSVITAVPAPVPPARGRRLVLYLALAGSLLAGVAIWGVSQASTSSQADTRSRQAALAAQQVLLTFIAGLPETADDSSLAMTRSGIDAYLASRPPADLAKGLQAAWLAKRQETGAARAMAAIAACAAATTGAQLAPARQAVDAFLVEHAQAPQAAAVKERWRQCEQATAARTAVIQKQEKVLAAIEACTVTADEGQVAATRSAVGAFLAAHAKEPQAAAVKERWGQALAAVDAGKRQREEAVSKARTAAQEVLTGIAALGDDPSAAALVTVRNQVDAFFAGNTQDDLRQAVASAWEVQQKAMEDRQKSGAAQVSMVASTPQQDAPVATATAHGQGPSMTLSPGDTPAWASASGTDQYGAWADLSVSGVVQRMRWIKPGTFIMGSSDQEAQWALDYARSAGSNVPNRDWFFHAPQHQVTFTRGFWLADTSCTQELWKAVTGTNPSVFKGDSRRPVEMVSWNDCQVFLAKLTTLKNGAPFMLPSVSQWEYACRAGTTTRFWNGDDPEGLAQIANTRDAAYCTRYPNDKFPHLKANDGQVATSPVKNYPPNPWGLYDMHGNVNQWCADWSGDYPTGPVTDPASPASGTRRAFRGGGWCDSASGCMSARRAGDVPEGWRNDRGFRFAAPPGRIQGEADPPAAGQKPAQPPTAAATPAVPVAARAGDARPAWPMGTGSDRYGAWADLTVGKVTQRMRWIPAGRFQMGSTSSLTAGAAPHAGGRVSQTGLTLTAPSVPSPVVAIESPGCVVTISRPFWLGDSAVTQGLWQAVTGSSPSRFAGDANRPVEKVSWDDCQAFLTLLNEQVRGLQASFPTEAQWEYACRAGLTGDYLGDPDIVAWNARNAGLQTHPVKMKPANLWGLCDTLGNVSQWCADWYGPLPRGAATDPTGPASGHDHVIRGGSWSSSSRPMTCRTPGSPTYQSDQVGFRLAIQASGYR